MIFESWLRKSVGGDVICYDEERGGCVGGAGRQGRELRDGGAKREILVNYLCARTATL